MLLSDSRKGELPQNPVSPVQPNLMASLVQNRGIQEQNYDVQSNVP